MVRYVTVWSVVAEDRGGDINRSMGQGGSNSKP